jgi:hypothetical protein
VLGAGVGSGGAAVVGYFAPNTTLSATADDLVFDVLEKKTCYIYLPCVAAVGLTIWAWLACTKSVRLLPSLVLSACSATFTVFSVKCTSLMLHHMFLAKDPTELQEPLFYGAAATIVVSGVFQLFWLTKALQQYPATAVVPT